MGILADLTRLEASVRLSQSPAFSGTRFLLVRGEVSMDQLKELPYSQALPFLLFKEKVLVTIVLNRVA